MAGPPGSVRYVPPGRVPRPADPFQLGHPRCDGVPSERQRLTAVAARWPSSGPDTFDSAWGLPHELSRQTPFSSDPQAPLNNEVTRLPDMGLPEPMLARLGNLPTGRGCRRSVREAPE